MRSTERGQRGVSLVEVVVATALMALGVVGGLTAWDTASVSAGKALRLAWARCTVRAELNAVLAAPYDDHGFYPVPAAYGADGTLRIDTVQVRGGDDIDTPADEQRITVTAFDPLSRSSALARATALKSRALGGSADIVAAQGGVVAGCPAR